MTSRSLSMFLSRALQVDEPIRDEETNIRIFWGVNLFILTVLILVCCVCWHFQDRILTSNGQRASDLAYMQSIARRRLAREAKNRISPEERTSRILASFVRHKVTMIVKQEDIVDELRERPVQNEQPAGVSQNEGEPTDNGGNDTTLEAATDAAEPVDLEVGIPIADADTQESEQCENGYLLLPGQRQVPNCCAICLCEYEVNDAVVWSSNSRCKHAFHQECMVDWLVKMRDGTPCPCCRQEFTDDLEEKALPKQNQVIVVWALPSIRF